MSNILNLKEKAKELQRNIPDYSMEMHFLNHKLRFVSYAAERFTNDDSCVPEEALLGLANVVDSLADEVEQIKAGLYDQD